MVDGFGWVVVVAVLAFVAWAIIKRLFKLALLGGLLIIGALALYAFVNQ